MAEAPKSVDEVIERMPQQFQPDAAKGFKAVYQYCITGDGGKDYYTDIDVLFRDGKFKAIYQYNCDDNGSWNVGWGWGCVNFREYTTDGALSGANLRFD